jgi:putative nucleotidyltransferase with HDIG domain
MDRESIISKLERILDLPTLPLIVDKVREQIRNPNADAQQIAKTIEDDPAMMAKILKVVNSPLYGARSAITSLQLAVARMGLNSVGNLALSTSVFSTFGENDRFFNREEFWRHCICTGIGQNILYDRCRESLKRRYTPDVLHLSGLLHDIGKLVLLRYFHDDFIKAVRAADDDAEPLTVMEKKFVGMDHAEIGAWLAKKWKLPEQLVEVVAYHHKPGSLSSENKELAMLCHCSNYICNLESLGNSGDVGAPSFDETVWEELGLNLGDIASIVDRISEESKNSEILMAFV